MPNVVAPAGNATTAVGADESWSGKEIGAIVMGCSAFPPPTPQVPVNVASDGVVQIAFSSLHTPASPGSPCGPWRPCGPCLPSGPVAPVSPFAPVGPVGP